MLQVDQLLVEHEELSNLYYDLLEDILSHAKNGKK